MSEQEMMEYINFLERQCRIMQQALWDIADVGKGNPDPQFGEMCHQMRSIASTISQKISIGV